MEKFLLMIILRLLCRTSMIEVLLRCGGNYLKTMLLEVIYCKLVFGSSLILMFNIEILVYLLYLSI